VQYVVKIGRERRERAGVEEERRSRSSRDGGGDFTCIRCD